MDSSKEKVGTPVDHTGELFSGVILTLWMAIGVIAVMAIILMGLVALLVLL